MAWQRLCSSEELKPGEHRRCDAAGQAILLARLESGLHAVHDTCLHRGASLSASPLEGDTVTCHLHFWRFSLIDGACAQVPSIKLRVFDVKEEEGSIYADL